MSRTILLADDSLTIQKVVELTFADTQYSVVTLSSGEQLLEQLPTVRPDVIICDIIMPGKDGYQVCQEIKSDPDTLHIPVVLLSGTFEPFDRDRALAAGCSEIITKPFEARKLVDTVDRLLSAPPEEATIEPDPVIQTSPTETVYIPRPEATSPPPIGSEPVAAAEPVADLAAADESGLDFTDTGFADMEAAGEGTPEQAAELPEEGLDFEFGSDEEEVEASAFDDAAEDQPTRSGLGEDEPTDVLEPEPSAATDPDLELAVSAPTFPPLPSEEPFPAEDPEAEAQKPMFDRSAPFLVDTGSPTADFGEGPFREGEETATDAPPAPSEPDERPEPATALPAATEPIARPLATWNGPSHDTEPGDQEEADGDGLAEEEVLAAEEAAAAADEEADTAPVSAPSEEEVAFTPPTPEPPPTPAVEAAPPATPGALLSDEDVDRVARRLLELASDHIESVAWEVIPDMAEIVVRERLRQLEAEAERASSDSLQ
jgi:CheY-like chemotaxis protein